MGRAVLDPLPHPVAPVPGRRQLHGLALLRFEILILGPVFVRRIAYMLKLGQHRVDDDLLQLPVLIQHQNRRTVAAGVIIADNHQNGAVVFEDHFDLVAVRPDLRDFSPEIRRQRHQLTLDLLRDDELTLLQRPGSNDDLTARAENRFTAGEDRDHVGLGCGTGRDHRRVLCVAQLIQHEPLVFIQLQPQIMGGEPVEIRPVEVCPFDQVVDVPLIAQVAF